jgi:hypothetical protein
MLRHALSKMKLSQARLCLRWLTASAAQLARPAQGYETERSKKYVVVHPRSLPESHLQEGLSLVKTATGLECAAPCGEAGRIHVQAC